MSKQQIHDLSWRREQFKNNHYGKVSQSFKHCEDTVLPVDEIQAPKLSQIINRYAKAGQSIQIPEVEYDENNAIDLASMDLIDMQEYIENARGNFQQYQKLREHYLKLKKQEDEAKENEPKKRGTSATLPAGEGEAQAK